MIPHDSPRAARRHALVRWSPVAMLAGALAAVSCSHLESSGVGADSGTASNSGSGTDPGASSGATGGSSGANPGGGSSGGTSPGGSGGPAGSGSSSSGSDMVVMPDAAPVSVQKMACQNTAYSDGWPIIPVDSPTAVSAAQAAVNPLSLPQLATIMRGEPSGCGPPNPTLNYTDNFRTPGIPGTLQGYKFRDGPRGVCLVANSTVAINRGNYSTTFPSGSARGAAFDVNLEHAIGAATGDEMVASGHNLLLAPVINILRHPAWGRSQETYGEDSFLLGRLGTAYVTGAQQYVAACVKHFAAYNIENGRTGTPAITAAMDEQTAYEVYGRHFEMVVQDGAVACVMAAYNLLSIANAPAQLCTANKPLLTDMLRTTFGFKGFVMSDWWAVKGQNACLDPTTEKTNAADAINAGLDMEMPWNLNFSQIEADVGNRIMQPQITAAATRIATQQFRFNFGAPGSSPPPGSPKPPVTTSFNNGTVSITNNDAHIALAYQAAVESMVLLKNDKNTLPIPSSVKTVAVIGAKVPFVLQNTDIANGTIDFANDVRTGDFGSSRTYPDPAKSTSAFAGIKAAAPSGVTVVTGTDASVAADFYVVVAGLTPEDEGEEYTVNDGSGGDRMSFDLDDKLVHAQSKPAVQNPLIQAVAALGKPMVVVLEGGSVISMPWLAQVPAVVMAWYPGQDGGHAMGSLLFGKANFSGKLPVTWPVAFADEPAFSAGPGNTTMMDYYLGYRYFDKNGKTPLYAFGHGLSYTSFSYANLQVPCASTTHGSVVNLQVDITNTGAVDGDEVTFVFVSYPGIAHRRSMKELKAFHRTTIKAGTTVRATIPLRISDLKYWDSTTHSWQWDTGPVQVMVGGSSDNLPLKDTFTVMN